MAWTDKYTASIKDESTDIITIQIQQDPLVGSAEVLTLADNPLSIYVPPKDIDSQIWGMGCRINVINLGSLSKYDHIFESAERDHRVIIRKGPAATAQNNRTLIFEGFIMPDIYGQQLRTKPEFSLTANNQISGLKDYKSGLLDTDNAFSTITLIALIRDILNSSGLVIPLYIKNTLFSKLYAAAYNINTTCYDNLTINRQIYIDQDEVRDGYSILEDILKVTFSRLYYLDGKWVIDRLTDMHQTNNYKIYPFTGAATTGSLVHPAYELGDEYKIANSGHLEYESGKKEYRVIVDFDKYDNLVDSSFQNIKPITLFAPTLNVWSTWEDVNIVNKSYNSPNVTSGIHFQRGTVPENQWFYVSLRTSFITDLSSDFSISISYLYDDLTNVLSVDWQGGFRLRYAVGTDYRVIERDGDKFKTTAALYDSLGLASAPVIWTETQITDIATESRVIKISEILNLEDIITVVNSDLSDPDNVELIIDIFTVKRAGVTQADQKIGDVTIIQNSPLQNNLITGTLNTNFQGVLEKKLRIYDGEYVNYKNTLLLPDGLGYRKSNQWSDNYRDHEVKIHYVLIHDVAQQHNTSRHSIKVDMWLKDSGEFVSLGSQFTYSGQLTGKKFIVLGYDYNVKMCAYRLHLSEYKDFDSFNLKGAVIPDPDPDPVPDPITYYYQDITIDATKIDATLTDFQREVILTSANHDFARGKPDGSDIRFSLGGDPLYFEKTSYSAGSQRGMFFVRIPSISSSTNTVFRMHYGNMDLSDGYNIASTWGASGYSAVWTPSLTLTDSTGNGHNSTVLTGINTFLGNRQCRQYSGTEDTTQIICSNSLKPDAFTLSTWVYPTGPGQSSRTNIMGPVQELNKGTFVWAIRYYSTGRIGFSAADSNGNWFDLESTHVLPLNQWSKIDYVIDPANAYQATLFVNDVQVSTSATLTTRFRLNENNPMVFSGHSEVDRSINRRFPGAISTTKISSVARSAAWRKAENNDVITIGAEQEGPYPEALPDFVAVTFTVTDTSDQPVEGALVEVNQ